MDNRGYAQGFPPVGFNVFNSVTLSSVPVNENFLSYQTESNLLNYSGGDSKLVKIPLQINDPNQTEILRSQQILITQYNKHKYPGC